MTRTTITLDQAVAVLNRHEHRGSRQWQKERLPALFSDGEDVARTAQVPHFHLTELEAVAIAERLEAEKAGKR